MGILPWNGHLARSRSFRAGRMPTLLLFIQRLTQRQAKGKRHAIVKTGLSDAVPIPDSRFPIPDSRFPTPIL
ncbi:hypothetical protein [Moorena sp. SIO3B2]|uniref:hypothetical protein n=1 Tax=Moorena sp. SIO3B2 TaxID=2607827 RepID=UPI0013C69C3D|nr:hypothetical protein [Moorena sp. SIO3B2]NEP36942.1 hypothetical protein [Moorena sp. SIO3B2]